MKKRIVSFIISILMLFNISILYPQVALANASLYAYQDALIPIETFATAIAIGSGIVASQSQDAINAASSVISKAIARVKAIACGDTNTAFRVIKGGNAEKPTNDDDKNNNKWFVRGAAVVATGKLVVDLTASGQMMEAINNEKGYSSTSYKTGIVSYNEFIKYATAESIIKQLAIYPPGRGSFENFIRLFEFEGFKSEDYFYLVNIWPSESYYPSINVTCFLKDANISYLKLANSISQIINNQTFINGTDLSFNSWYMNSRYDTVGTFYNKDDLVYTLSKYFWFSVDGWAPGSSPTSKLNKNAESTISTYSRPKIGGRSQPLFGYIPASKVLYELTNNTYKVGESTATNFPNWVQSSIETINGNLESINLAINNLKLPQTWGDTQTNIQTGTAPANVINQYINNWSNPEQVPDPEPDPGPNPDPEPDPNPQPTPEPAPTDDYLKVFMLPATITEKFPFCVPFDIAKCLKLFSVSGREAPKWEGSIKYGVKGENEYKVTIDLKDFEPIAKIVRPLEFIVFLVGLIIITRDLIKG